MAGFVVGFVFVAEGNQDFSLSMERGTSDSESRWVLKVMASAFSFSSSFFLSLFFHFSAIFSTFLTKYCSLSDILGI